MANGASMTPRDVLRDPEFHRLPLSDRRSILSSIDAEFAALPESDQSGIFSEFARSISGGELTRLSRGEFGVETPPVPGFTMPGALPELPRMPTEPREPSVLEKGWEVATTPFLKAAGLHTLSETYDMGTDAMVDLVAKVISPKRPKAARARLKEDFPQVVFTNELVRGIPELADFMTSPLGAATLKLQAARPAVRAFVNAAFATDMGRQAKQALNEAWRDPSAESLGRAAKSTAIALLPWVHAAGTEVRTRQFAKQQAEARAAQKARPETLEEVLPPVPKEPGPRLSREERRALSRPPEEGVPERVSRAVDARERLAGEIFEKPFQELSNPDRLAIDSLVNEGYGFAVRPPAERAIAGAEKPAVLPEVPRKGKTPTEALPARPPAPAGVVEPWRMTLEEYAGKFPDVTDKAKLRGAHEHLVAQAVREGKEVPEPVLAQYPRAAELLKKEKPPEKAPLELAVAGDEGTAYTPKETAVPFRYAVTEAGKLTTSFDEGYDTALQPRDITRKGTRQRVEQRKSDLNPAKMGESVNAGDGAPLSRADGMVLTRNHGVQALKELYEQASDRGQAYKEWLTQNAERFGLDPEAVAAMDRPVLHRVLTAEMDRKTQVKLAEEANMPTVAAMSEAETAAMLSKRLTGEMMEAFEVTEEGTPSPEFARAFVRDLPVEVQAGFFDERGRLSQSGIRTIRNTIFARAYPDTAAVERLAEATDSNVRNVSNGMLMAAPKFARLQEGVDKGERWDLNIAPELSKAASTLSALRDQRMTVDDWLRQGDIFGRDPLEVRLMEVINENRRSAKRIGEVLKEYADSVERLGSPKQETMFGAPEVPSKLEVLNAAYQRVKERAEAQKGPTLFEERPEGGAAAARVPEEAGRAGEAARVPETPVERPPDTLDRLETEAREWFKANKPKESFLRGERGTEDPQAYAKAMVIAIAKMRRGVRSFEDWSREMLAELGEWVRPRLNELYRIAQERVGPVEEINAQDYFNFKRANISDQMKEQLKGRVIETVARTGRFPKEKETWKEIRQQATKLGPEVAKQLKPFREAQAEYRQVRLIAREIINEQNQKIYDARQQLDREAGQLTQDQVLAREREIDAMERDSRGLLDVWMRMRSEDGRNLAMHRMMADDAVSARGGFDLTYWVSRAKRAMGIPAGAQLPDKQYGKLAPVIAEGERAWKAAAEKARRGREPPAEQIPLLPEVPGTRPPTGPTPEQRIERGVRQAVAVTERRIKRLEGVEPTPAPSRLTPAEKAKVDADPRVVAARRKLMKVMAEMEQTGFLEALSAFRKAGLLTGFKTHMRNIGGNLTFGMIEELSRVPASTADMALSVFTGQRTVQGARLNAKRIVTAADKGIREGLDILEHGTTADQLSRVVDMAKEINTNSRLLNVYINGVFRLMAAEDRVFKTLALHRSLTEQAWLRAKNEGRGADRAEELFRNPTEEMQTQAIAAAEFATFNNRNMIASRVSSEVGRLYAGALPEKITAFGVDMVAPYKNTPSNIVARIFDYLPGGTAVFGPKRGIPAAVARSIVNKALKSEDQRIISEAFGRGAVGAGVVYLGYKLAEAGFMTGTREQEQPGKRAVEQAAGRLPGSILFGGKWRQVSPFAPTGNVLTVGATLYRERTREVRQEVERPYRMAGVALETAMEQPFMKGISDIQRAMEAPARRVEAYAGSSLGSFVPTLVADFASVFDPNRRAYWKEGPLSGVKARLPGLRQTVQPAVDVLGRVMSQYRTQAVDPTLAQPAKELSDPVLGALIESDVRIGWPQRQEDEPDEQYGLRSMLIGRTIEYHLTREVQKDRYRNALAGEPRRLLLDRAIHAARSEVSRRTTQRGSYQKGTPEDRLRILHEEIDRANERIPTLPPVPGTAPILK